MGNMHSIVYIVVKGVISRCIGLINMMRCRHGFFPYADSLLRLIDNFIGKFKVGMFFVHCGTWYQMYMI